LVSANTPSLKANPQLCISLTEQSESNFAALTSQSASLLFHATLCVYPTVDHGGHLNHADIRGLGILRLERRLCSGMRLLYLCSFAYLEKSLFIVS